jgi:hypothetical protein
VAIVSSGGGDPPCISSGVVSSCATGVRAALRLLGAPRLAALARLSVGRRFAAGRRLAPVRRFSGARFFRAERDVAVRCHLGML